ncbi:MAG: histidinol dehydrogenase [Planctomycetia bacterium]|nr:histidinol dehydrogenase [Planctomycetia bacterium]
MPDLAIQRIDSRRDDLSAALTALREKLSPRGDIVSEAGRRRTIEVFGEALSPQAVVERICRDIETQGLEAVLDYSRRIDKAELTKETLRIPMIDLELAHTAVSAEPQFLATVRRIRDNIRRFQEAILHRDVRVALPDGGYLAQRYLPLERVGICVPGGAAAYPSTVLMTAVPAQVTGVKEIAIVAPPTKFGARNPYVLATCHELGISEIYCLGGAQAVAALAYGVEGLPRVDKIVGPGNLFVALAKKHVFGHVDIDAIAGPSEVVIMADITAPPRFVAADLIAQAEHAPGASILITWEPQLLDGVAAELSKQLATLARGDLARESLEQFGALILVEGADEACRVADLIAPEHLHIATTDPESLVAKIPHAGAVFLGHYSPVALGDYAAGPSHVLPTSGTARFASGLSANSFLRSRSVISFTRESLAATAGLVSMMADKEGLTAHRRSVEVRQNLSP